MASVKVFFLLATVWGTAQSIPFDEFLVPFYAINNLDSAWRICYDNSTIMQRRYQQVLRGSQNCFSKFSQNNQSICHSFEINVQRCSQPVVDLFVDCLPEKSKGIPPAAMKAATSVVETFCTSSGELLLEAFNPCIYEFTQQRNKTIKAECRKEIFYAKLEKFEKELPSISELCEFGHQVRDCWQGYVNQDCDSLKARELFSKFYNAGLSGCSKK